MTTDEDDNILIARFLRELADLIEKGEVANNMLEKVSDLYMIFQIAEKTSKREEVEEPIIRKSIANPAEKEILTFILMAWFFYLHIKTSNSSRNRTSS